VTIFVKLVWRKTKGPQRCKCVIWKKRLDILRADSCLNNDPSQACFQQDDVNPPTCHPNNNSNSTEMMPTTSTTIYNPQHYCSILRKKRFNAYFADNHVDAFVDIHVNSQLCNTAKQVYHLCYWCKSNWTRRLLFRRQIRVQCYQTSAIGE